MTRPASDGWERWPQRKTLDGKTYLCRWCAKPLKGQATSYCSGQCEHEIYRRCMFASLRRQLYEIRGRKCEQCGVNIEDLQTFFKWYNKLWHKYCIGGDSFKNREYTRDWPSLYELKEQLGYLGSEDLWECNHKVALAEGGNLVDPENLEILCLKCHKKHTAALKRRLAKEKKNK